MNYCCKNFFKHFFLKKMRLTLFLETPIWRISMASKYKKEKTPESSGLTREPFPNSKKIYVDGKIHNIQVAMREISIEDDEVSGMTVYDTSGPYTDLDIDIDAHKGLKPMRDKWIRGRGDVEQLPNFTSEFTRKNAENSNGIKFVSLRKPLRAIENSNVTQMHYAKKGIIHEREFSRFSIN